MKLIVGLGNPGAEYAQTRHNAGFLVLDALALRLGVSFTQRKFKGYYAQGTLAEQWRGPAAGDGKLLLVKPQTYMNLSGESVASFMGYFKLAGSDLLVVVDDVALPLGRLRLRRSGSAGGHKGLGDVEACLGGRAYARLRLGVGGRAAGGEQVAPDLRNHVLSRFTLGEVPALAEAVARACDACLTWAGRGIEEAMNTCNARGARGDQAKAQR
jgi:PTH1 family peptidyl-tRNA hydrolase